MIVIFLFFWIAHIVFFLTLFPLYFNLGYFTPSNHTKRMFSPPSLFSFGVFQAASKIVVYTSSQSHSSIQKACMIAGIPMERLRLLDGGVATDFAMDTAVLQKKIEEDKASGLIPAAVFATMGTTSSAAVDDLQTIGRICQENNAWMHVDAAYAGSACMCPEFRHYLDGVELADSFNFNAHKWMMTNFDASLLFVKNR